MKKKINGFYLSSVWVKIKTDLFMLRGERCEVCGSRRSIQVHHLTYDNFGGNEEPQDLIILCGACHQKEHGFLKLTAEDKRRVNGRKSRRKKIKAPKKIDSKPLLGKPTKLIVRKKNGDEKTIS